MDNIISTDFITKFFSGSSLTAFFIKAFSIVFSLLFITYAVVTYKQVQEMVRTLKNARNSKIIFITFIQIIIGLLLLLFAILFI